MNVRAQSRTVLIANESHERLAELAEVVEHIGHRVVAHAITVAEAADVIAREDPDASLVAVHEDDEHALDLVEQICSFASGPVVAVLERESPLFVRRAAERGIDAYAHAHSPAAVQSALEVALRRRDEVAQLERRVGQLETALERRAAIERAKGILMERHGVDEGAAFALLRSHARGSNRAVVELARAVADGHALLPPHGR